MNGFAGKLHGSCPAAFHDNALDSGKISSAGAAVQLEKLAKKDGNKAASLMTQIAQLPEGEAVSKKVVDEAFSAVSGRNRKDIGVSEAVPADYAPLSITSAESITPARTRVNPGKMKQVADMLGSSDGDEYAELAATLAWARAAIGQQRPPGGEFFDVL